MVAFHLVSLTRFVRSSKREGCIVMYDSVIELDMSFGCQRAVETSFAYAFARNVRWNFYHPELLRPPR